MLLYPFIVGGYWGEFIIKPPILAVEVPLLGNMVLEPYSHGETPSDAFLGRHQFHLSSPIPRSSPPEIQPTTTPNLFVTSPCEQYRPLFEQYDWDVPLMLAIAQAESGCKATASSPTNDHGLLQIHNGLALYGEQIYDPVFNIAVSYSEKYKKGGYTHWTVYKTREYLKYLVH